MIINRISVPCTITIQKRHTFEPVTEELPIHVEVSLHQFQSILDRNCVYNVGSDEINMIFLSNLKDITISHYMDQPRSMLCRKLERYDIGEDGPLLLIEILIIIFSRTALGI